MGSDIYPELVVGQRLIQACISDFKKIAWQVSAMNDYSSLLDRPNTLQPRADKIMNTATAIVGVVDRKKAQIESRNMSRIAYLALVLVHMSFVSTFLSIGDVIYGGTPWSTPCSSWYRYR
jgi:hypothetical protein